MQTSNTQYLVNEHITFKHAIGLSDKSGTEFHSHHEIIWFMGGTAFFISENIHTEIKPNTLLLIPCESYHQLLITGDQEAYHRCVFHFLHIPQMEQLIQKSLACLQMLDMTPRLQDLFQQMIALSVSDSPPESKGIVMQAILTLILHELSLHSATPVLTQISDTITDKCIDYVNRNITQLLTIQTIAKALNVSESYLSHTFKEQMNISLHQYILKKRLVMAHHKILDGVPPVKASLECGFQDYSGFYKQFRKTFNASPVNILWSSHSHGDFHQLR